MFRYHLVVPVVVLLHLLVGATQAEPAPQQIVLSDYGDLDGWVKDLPNAHDLPLDPGFPQINGQGQFTIGFNFGSSTQLRQLGFDAAMREVYWHRIAPSPGTYTSEPVAQVLEGLAASGMKLILQLSWHQPAWLPAEWRLLDPAGEPTEADWFYHNLWHPEARAQQAKVIETVCSVTAKHPAMLGYILCNEPGMGGFHVGYGPYAVAAFRDWLRDNYGSIGRLNARWGTELPGFDLVEPPRPFVEGKFSVQALQQTNRALWLDWITFRNESLAQHWQFLADEIRKHHPEALITIKLMWKGVDSNIAAAQQQNYRLWGKALSVMGNDPYPHPYENFLVRWLSDACWSYGEGKRTWFTEWNAAFLEREGVPELPLGSYSAWMWQAIGRGVSGFSGHYVHLGADSGLTYNYNDHTFDASFWETQKTQWQVRMVQPWLMRARPAPTEIAILQSWPTYIQQPDGEPGSYTTAVIHSLYNTHLSYRYIDEHMLRHEDLTDFKVLLLPGSICLAQEDWEALDRFVRAGGWVVAWPKSGDRDELYQPHPERVTERFGVQVSGYRESPLTPLEKITVTHHSWNYRKEPLDREIETMRWAKSPMTVERGGHLLKKLAGVTLDGAARPQGFEDYHGEAPQETIAELEPVNARVITRFEDGRPAMTQNGHFLYIATSPKHSSREWDEAVRRLLEAMGVRPHGYVVDKEGHHVHHVDLAMMQGPGFRLAIVTNHALSKTYDGRPVPGLTIGLRGDENTRVVRLLDVPEELSAKVRGEYLTVSAAFMPGEAKVFLLVP